MFEDPQILGKLYGYLISHRILRTRVGENEKFFPEEKELAQAYKSMDKRSKIAFEEFLSGSGFKLIRYDAFSYPGLPQGSTCYVLIRNSMEHVPQWLKPAEIYDVVIARKGHKSNTQRVLRLWFFIIWLNLLALIYKGNRPLSAVSDAGKMSFTDDLLIKQITDFIELEIRQKSDADAYDQFIRDVLLADNPRDLRRRITGFLEFMTRISYLSRYTFEGQAVYTQTLVMASEIAANYSDCFAYLVNEYDAEGFHGEGSLFDGEEGRKGRDPDGDPDTSQITQVLKNRYFEGYPSQNAPSGEAEPNEKDSNNGPDLFEKSKNDTEDSVDEKRVGVQQSLFSEFTDDSDKDEKVKSEEKEGKDSAENSGEGEDS